MKKLITLVVVSALSVSVFAMAKAPADAKDYGAKKACAVKKAGACGITDKSCKKEAAEACAKEATEKTCAVKKAGACGITDKSFKKEAAGACAKEATEKTCAVKKAKACAKEAVSEKAECAGGTCPLPKQAVR